MDGGDMPKDGHDHDGMMDDDDMRMGDGPIMADPLMGNLVYTMVAASNVAYAVLNEFVWTNNKTFLDEIWDADGMTEPITNAISFYHYGLLGFFGIALLTSLLSLAGIATDINAMVWIYGEGVWSLFALAM